MLCNISIRIVIKCVIGSLCVGVSQTASRECIIVMVIDICKYLYKKCGCLGGVTECC